MKSFIYILLTSLTFLVVGCQNESEEIRLINQAERLFDAYPDSVITTLDSIPLPEEMSPRLVARWCMLYARAADKIEDEMPYTNQLEIALKYYQKKKMREEEFLPLQNGRFTCIRTACPCTIIPASTSSPSRIERGILSPVNAEVSNCTSASNKTPSKGTRPPGFTSIRSPTFTSFGDTFIYVPVRHTSVRSGRTSNKSLIFFEALFTARSCNLSPTV